jgi:hypothetical protein
MIKRPAHLCIVYGFCEGPRIGERFEQAFRRAGFSLVREPRRADIIVAHSGGCFELRGGLEQKLVVYIGLPYHPGTTMLGALGRKIWRDFRAYRRSRSVAAWLGKTWWNMLYFWNFAHNWRMWRGRQAAAWRDAPHVVLIRNEYDPFCTPAAGSIPFIHTPAVVLMPGQHDDCWLRPQPYVHAIQSSYGDVLLAQAGR